MPLIEDKPKYSAKTLIIIGIPAFLAAVVISTASHQYIHHIADNIFVGSKEYTNMFCPGIKLHGLFMTSPVAAAAGPIWTFFLAIVSFGLYLHNPRNLFLGSMAFVNASSRMPETITLFLQLLLHNKTTLLTDESISLVLLRLNDPTISIVLLCFFSLTIFFLTITIVHDTKTVPLKWLIAAILFILLIPLQDFLWNNIAQLLS
jgi:hypothetical protein